MPGRIAKLIALITLLWLPQAQATITVNATRVWPAQDYTRLTLETSRPIDYNMFTISNPERLVIDLKNVDLHGALDSLAGKISSDDPYIKSVRVGQFKPNVVRLVLDLKTGVKPQLFSLKPVAEYGYRLVLDVYPATSVDPLMALAQHSENKLSLDAASNPATAAASSAQGTPSSSPAPVVASTPATGPHANSAIPDAGKPEASKYPSIYTHTLTIAIDAGHGGEDPGAHGHHGTLEKNVTLSIARRLRDMVNDTDGLRAVMTRDGDYFIPLSGRVEKARKAHADLFVSIHADAYVNRRASGSSVFALSEHGATSAAARWLAKNENDADLIGGVNIAGKDPYLARTLLDLSQTATISDSLKLARQVLHQLGGINNLHRGRVEQAGFAVLKAPDIPSILVETAFISNPAEERRLKSDEYQNKVARAILGGIKRYLAQNPPISRPKMAQND
jgi:N-acetylmuramoyl-L-alanine amidase